MKLKEKVVLISFIIFGLLIGGYITYKSGVFSKLNTVMQNKDNQILQNDKVEIEYEITLENLIDGKANVKIHMSNIKGSSINMRELSYLPYKNQINKLIVTNNKGVRLDISKAQPIKDERKNMAPQWAIELNNSESITIEYSKVLKYIDKSNNSERYWGYIGDGFACFMGGQLFLVPSDSAIIDPNIKVKINAPKNTDILVPWSKDRNVYYPNKNENTNKFRHLAEALNYSTIVVGNYDIYTTSIEGTKINIGLPSNYNKEDATKIVKDIENIFQYYTDLFGQSIDNVYQIVLYNLPHDGKDIVNLEWTNNQAVSLRGKNVNLNKISHQIFHRWNGFWYGWKQKELGYLIRESIVRYYENKSAVVLADKLNKADYKSLSDLMQIYDKYKLTSEADRKIYNETKDSFYTYDVGSLLCLYLDIDIMNATNNKKSLNDLLRIIWQDYGKQEKIIDKNVFLSTLKEMTGKDYSFFYDSYIAGNKYLELQQLFNDYDGDEVTNYMEILQGTNSKDKNSYNEAVKTKLKTIIYPRGETYIGEIKDNMPNGIGAMTLLDGTVFEGNWINGKKQGKGKLIYKNNKVQEGYWKDDKISEMLH